MTGLESPAGKKILIVAALVLVAIIGACYQTGDRVESDAANNLRMAVNLAHQGTMSMDEKAPFRPSMYREPVPIFAFAAGVVVVDAFMGRPQNDADYYSGKRAHLIKLVNIAWLVAYALAIICAVQLFTGSLLLGLVGVAAVLLKVPATPTGLENLAMDELMSELPSAAVLVWAGVAIAKAIAQGQWRHFALAGALLGVAALIKGAVLYVFCGVLLGTALLLWLQGRNSPGQVRNTFSRTAVLGLAFTIVCGPWILRNHVDFGIAGITDRGGVVLLFRAEKNQMTWEEYRGSFYVWAPRKLRPLVGPLLGFGPSDLPRHGRLERLNREEDSDFYAADFAAELAGRPQDAVSFYHKVRAERVKLQNELRSVRPDFSPAADQILEHRALQMIADDPFKHLAMTIPFLWRGATIVFPVLLIAMLYAWRTRKAELAAFLMPAFFMVLFYGFFTHFLPRYSAPVAGIAVVAGIVLAHAAIQRWRHRRGNA